MLKRMLRRSDVMPGDFYREVVERLGLERSRRQTYASVALVLLDELERATRENPVHA